MNHTIDHRNRLAASWTLLLFSLFASTCHAQDPAGKLAKHLLTKAGMTHGIASLPRCSDGELALAVAQNSKMLVHAMSPDRKVVDAMVQLADAEGILSRSLYVEQGSLAALPYADHLVDLVLITNLTEGDLVNVPLKEIVRILSPWRGKAIVGLAKADGKGGSLSKSALENWAKAPGTVPAEVWEDDSGVWARIGKSPLAGAQAWSHRYHDASNNTVSQDTTLKPPFMSQWWGLPLHEGWWGTTVVGAGGRLFTIWAANRYIATTPRTLTARSVYNGCILWERVLTEEKYKAGYTPARSCMVATPERLYLVDRDGVLMLDAESGAECGRIAGPQPGGQVKWIAIVEGVLAMLTGDADDLKDVNNQMYPVNPRGTHLTVHEIPSGKLLWKQEETKSFDERMVAVHGGQVYAYISGSRVLCLDAKTGKLRWENTSPELLAVLGRKNEKEFNQALFSQKGLIATDHSIAIGLSWQEKIAFLSSENGSILCFAEQDHKSGRTARILNLDGKWLVNAGVVDLSTGKLAGKVNIPNTKCAPSTAAPGLFIGAFGRCVDQATGRTVWAHSEVKSPCDMGTLVTDGLIVTPPSTCRCDYDFGYRALISVSSNPASGKKTVEPLTSVTRKATTPLEISSADWPTYRANISRTGATAVKIPNALTKRWTWSPAKPVAFEPSPARDNKARIRTLSDAEYSVTSPVCAAGKVWLGDAGGVIRCLDAANGRLLWSFPTGTRMLASPSVAEGRLYAGSGNGWIYCLDATTGHELWRFHAAPRDRYMMWYGHLFSSWPVVTGVLVHDGTAYAAAGYHGLNDVHVYALDAATGQQRWVTHDFSQPNTPGGGTGPIGNMTLANGRLFLSSGIHKPVSFDLKSGECAIADKPTSWYSMESTDPPPRGSEIAVFGGRFLLLGGRRLVHGYEERNFYPDGIGFTFFGLNPDGTLKPTGAFLMSASAHPPVWDTELMVLLRMNNLQLDGWNIATLTTEVDKLIATGGINRVSSPECPIKKWPRWDMPNATVPGGPMAAPAPPPMRIWEGPGHEVNALALAANAVVVAFREPGGKWILAGLNRGTGALLWSLDLPCEPIFNGICIDREGQVLIALRNGSLAAYGAK
ncbi:MAG: PQQ-binding-like beta-propeller repeat protein [Planctomycetes bacterium]|nr:PQQ-binding-like beta-propeller repeat protein [Planctomycetota bacterium]